MDIKELRAQVARQHVAANKKVSRIRTRSGIELNGTLYDVRRNKANLKGYNAAQLRAYSASLSEFNSRSNNFTPGRNNVPIPNSLVREHREVQKRVNALARRSRGVIDPLHGPSGMTIGERTVLMTPTNKVGSTIGGARPYKEGWRDMSKVTGPEGLKILTDSLKKKLGDDYYKKHMQGTRRSVRKMLKDTGLDAFKADADSMSNAKLLRGLSDFQLEVAWNETNLPSALTNFYDNARSKGDTPKEKRNESVDYGYRSDVHEILQWAATIEEPKKPTARNRAKPAKRRGR